MDSSRVIEALEAPQRNDHSTRLAYWYFRFDDAVTLNVSSMVRSFIRQLTPFPLPASVRKLWDQHRSRSMEPDDKILIELLDSIIGGLDEVVYIIIDALDECPRDVNRRHERDILFGCIKHLMQQHGERIRILVTSRPEPDIHDALLEYTGLDIEFNMKRDVRKFVENALQGDRWLNGWTDTIKMEIKERLLSITDSRFLWTDLQLERLKECHTHDQIREYLRTMPQSLEDTYRKTLKRISPKDISIARRILIWLTTSLRPLTLKEVAAAADLVRPESVLRICTSTLVTLVYEGSPSQVNSTYQIVKLAHFSVREFLVSGDEIGRPDEENPWYFFSNLSAHAAIAEQTLDTLLKTQDLDITEEIISTKPLIQYSAVFWYQHFRAVEPEAEEYPDIPRGVDMLFSPQNSGAYINWLRLHNCDAPVPNGSDYTLKLEAVSEPLYYASLLGLHTTVANLVEAGANVMTRGRMYRSPLVAASVHGFPETVNQLLKATTNIETADACQIAAKISGRNISKIMSDLLERSGLLPVTDEVVRAAIQNERSGPQALRIFMQYQEEISITEDMIRTAAGNWGSGRQLMTMLLDRCGTIPIPEDVLMAAVENEQCGKEVISTLVDRCSAHMTITEALVKSAADNKRNRYVINFLLGRPGAEPEITEGGMIQIARRFDKEIILKLLGRSTFKLPLTHHVILDMAKMSPKSVIECLLRRHGKFLPITEEIHREFARRFDQEWINILLDQRRADVPITEKILKAVVGNNLGDALLSQQRGSQITPEGFNLACRNWRSGEEILRSLLRYQKTEILLSKDVVIAAAENSRSGSRLIIALINHQRVGMRLEEKVVTEIVRRFDNEVIEVLFDRQPDIELTETILVASACNVKYEGNLMEFLLKAQGSKPPITQDVVEAAMRNTAVGFEIIELLVKEGLMIPVTKEMFRVAEENKECGSRIIKLLLDRQHDVPISKDLTESFEIIDLDQGSDTLEEGNTDILTSAAMDDQSKDCEDSRSFHSDESSQDEIKDLLEDEDSSAEDIDLSNCRTSSAGSLDLDRFTRLRTLSLRQNRLDHSIFKRIPSTIKSLDLCDNFIPCIKNTDSFVELRYLNLEFNKIRRIEGLTHMTQLTDLYLGRNKISKIQNLDTLGHLRHLDLTDNRIRSLENLNNLQLLQEIYLDKNKITEIKSLDSLINLRVLSLQFNRLTSMSGLSQLLHLEELYLGGNYLTKISGLESCSNLRVLDLRWNHITGLENLAHLEHLEELWASYNKISSLEDIEVQLRDKDHLGSIDFKGNPLETPGCKSLWLALPQIFSIDGATRPVDL
ncbi:NACHT domain-containing protein [Penicillium frequentans]|nr:NACHT domain-containing protein [Penicillium glabrum]